MSLKSGGNPAEESDSRVSNWVEVSGTPEVRELTGLSPAVDGNPVTPTWTATGYRVQALSVDPQGGPGLASGN